MTACLFSVLQCPSEKGSTLKREEFAPNGSKFFPFKVDPLSEVLKANAFPNKDLLLGALFPFMVDFFSEEKQF